MIIRLISWKRMLNSFSSFDAEEIESHQYASASTVAEMFYPSKEKKLAASGRRKYFRPVPEKLGSRKQEKLVGALWSSKAKRTISIVLCPLEKNWIHTGPPPVFISGK